MLFAVVDEADEISETNETDNQVSALFNVRTRPDLVISEDDIEFLPESPIPNGILFLWF